MDPILLTVLFKGVGMLLAIAGGIIIGRYGFHLYRDGAGLGRDSAALTVGPVKIKANSVGSVVMATAFLWAWAGVMLSPNLDRKGDNIRIYSFKTSNGYYVQTQAVTAKMSKKTLLKKQNPAELKKLLEQAVVNVERTNAGAVVELDGKPASIDFSTVNILQNPAGEYLLSTTVKAGNEFTTIVFEPKIDNQGITFTPSIINNDIKKNDLSNP